MTPQSDGHQHAGGGLLFLLTCAMGVGPFLMYGLSAVSTEIMNDLQIGPGQFGWLATVCFLAATISSVGLGRVSDRASSRTLVLFIFVGAVGALILTSFSAGYLALLIAVTLSGVAQAMSNPATNRLINGHVQAHKRSGWIGIKQSGVQGSQLAAGLTFPTIVIVLGWREGAVIAAVAFSLALVFAWRFIPISNTTRTLPVLDVNKVSSSLSSSTPWNAQRLPIYAVYAFLSGAALQATNVYLPLFSQQELGFSLLLGGITAAVAGGVGLVARIIWGAVVAKRDSFTLLVVLGLGSALGSGFLLVAGELKWPIMLWSGVILHGALALAINVVLMVAVLRDSSPQNVGAVSGIVALGMYLGFALGPFIMGFVLEFEFGFSAGWGIAGVTYLLCAALALAPKYRRRAP